jgi:hypothetical protein
MLEARLALIEAEREIEQLQYRYTAACDHGYDVDAIASCFTPTGRWVANGFADCHGRDEIRAFFTSLARVTPQVLHYATSPRITVRPDGQTATAEFYLLCLSTVTGGSDGAEAVIILGTYSDRCVKVNSEWLFEELRVDVRHISEWTQGWVNQPWRGARSRPK